MAGEQKRLKQLMMAGVTISGSPGIVFDDSFNVYKDVYFPWQDFFAAASGNGLSGSVAVALIASCAAALRFTGTKATCMVYSMRAMPPDAASSGSGVLFMNWSDGTTVSAVATVAACLYAWKHDDALSAASILVSTCAEVTGGGTASDLNSTSLAAVNAPALSGVNLILRFTPNAADANNTSGSNFHLLGFKYRYRVNKIGSAAS